MISREEGVGSNVFAELRGSVWDALLSVHFILNVQVSREGVVQFWPCNTPG